MATSQSPNLFASAREEKSTLGASKSPFLRPALRKAKAIVRLERGWAVARTITVPSLTKLGAKYREQTPKVSYAYSTAPIEYSTP